MFFWVPVSGLLFGYMFIDFGSISRSLGVPCGLILDVLGDIEKYVILGWGSGCPESKSRAKMEAKPVALGPTTTIQMAP